MKKLIYITLIAFSIVFSGGDSVANTIDTEGQDALSTKTGGETVVCRIVHQLMEVHVFFHGPNLRIGDDVLVRIYDADSGALLQQEFLVGNGGGSIEKFSIEGLETGIYFMVVEGEVYDTQLTFMIP